MQAIDGWWAHDRAAGVFTHRGTGERITVTKFETDSASLPTAQMRERLNTRWPVVRFDYEFADLRYPMLAELRVIRQRTIALRPVDCFWLLDHNASLDLWRRQEGTAGRYPSYGLWFAADRALTDVLVSHSDGLLSPTLETLSKAATAGAEPILGPPLTEYAKLHPPQPPRYHLPRRGPLRVATIGGWINGTWIENCGCRYGDPLVRVIPSLSPMVAPVPDMARSQPHWKLVETDVPVTLEEISILSRQAFASGGATVPSFPYFRRVKDAPIATRGLFYPVIGFRKATVLANTEAGCALFRKTTFRPTSHSAEPETPHSSLVFTCSAFEHQFEFTRPLILRDPTHTEYPLTVFDAPKLQEMLVEGRSVPIASPILLRRERFGALGEGRHPADQVTAGDDQGLPQLRAVRDDPRLSLFVEEQISSAIAAHVGDLEMLLGTVPSSTAWERYFIDAHQHSLKNFKRSTLSTGLPWTAYM
jgi:hypothetical protein